MSTPKISKKNKTPFVHFKDKATKDSTVSPNSTQSGCSPLPKPDFSSIEQKQSAISFHKKGSYKRKKSFIPESPMKKNHFYTPFKIPNSKIDDDSSLSKKLFFGTVDNAKSSNTNFSAFNRKHFTNKKLNFNELPINENEENPVEYALSGQKNLMSSFENIEAAGKVFSFQKENHDNIPSFGKTMTTTSDFNYSDKCNNNNQISNFMLYSPTANSKKRDYDAKDEYKSKEKMKMNFFSNKSPKKLLVNEFTMNIDQDEDSNSNYKQQNTNSLINSEMIVDEGSGFSLKQLNFKNKVPDDNTTSSFRIENIDPNMANNYEENTDISSNIFLNKKFSFGFGVSPNRLQNSTYKQNNPSNYLLNFNRKANNHYSFGNGNSAIKSNLFDNNTEQQQNQFSDLSIKSKNTSSFSFFNNNQRSNSSGKLLVINITNIRAFILR